MVVYEVSVWSMVKSGDLWNIMVKFGVFPSKIYYENKENYFKSFDIKYALFEKLNFANHHIYLLNKHQHDIK